ncbi:MAG: helix-turn-helix domain-containing protein [Acidobacteriota bacterium]|nr:helix-turn-helix domain-containing protein [Acidobacteriota bacterium]
MSAVSSLSRLQVYGAVVGNIPLDIPITAEVPKAGVRERLELDLLPAFPLHPRQGITLLKFSIPGPVESLLAMGKLGRPDERNQQWQLFKRRVVPYLSLPRGIGVHKGHNFIYRLKIRRISDQLGPPVDAALAAMQEHLRRAELRLIRLYEAGKEPTEQAVRSVEAYRERIEWLESLRQKEEDFYRLALGEEAFVQTLKCEDLCQQVFRLLRNHYSNIMNWVSRHGYTATWTTAAAAEELGVSERTLRRWCSSGKLPAIKVARRWVILSMERRSE